MENWPSTHTVLSPADRADPRCRAHLYAWLYSATPLAEPEKKTVLTHCGVGREMIPGSLCCSATPANLSCTLVIFPSNELCTVLRILQPVFTITVAQKWPSHEPDGLLDAMSRQLSLRPQHQSARDRILRQVTEVRTTTRATGPGGTYLLDSRRWYRG